MNYSPPDMQSLPRQDPLRNSYDVPYYNQQYELTSEEQKVLNQCFKEGIFQKAIPMAFLFGLGGYTATKFGIFKSKYGPKPVVLGFSIIGFIFGRVAQSKVCIQRVLQVPDGNLRKLIEQRKSRDYLDFQTPNNYYATIDSSKTEDSTLYSQSNYSDIDIPTTSSFDTVPSDYYQKVEDEIKDTIPVESYASYDDLRQKNRQNYKDRISHESPYERYSGPLQDKPIGRSTAYEKDPNVTGQQTKYGDVWE